MSERDVANQITDILNNDFQDIMQRIMGREPRYRYFETTDGWQFHWTVEKMGNGKYAFGMYRPRGKGSRMSKKKQNELLRKGAVLQIELVEEAYYTLRKDAKEKALTRYRQHKAELAKKADAAE